MTVPLVFRASSVQCVLALLKYLYKKVTTAELFSIFIINAL
jgi:hypothetical protein